ncbi:MAG: tRNA (cytidine(34)-2'-O)-methyltransferase [Elusimicrobia bacterium]|nr:tRNA (cytidine(34)-2'-O)-methyltransferase [Elusimicrobiota bacterium]
MKSSHSLNIVLIEPEIPQNTGNIGRTCVGLDATLHLVGQLGFSLDEKDLKRAGLDYWPKLKLKRHDRWESFLASIEPTASLTFFSTHGTQSLWEVSFQFPCYLVFGSESRGFPPSFYERYKNSLVRIPTTGPIRSLNLSTAVGIAAFEAVRPRRPPTCHF